MTTTSSSDKRVNRRVAIASALGAMVAPRFAFGRNGDDAEIARVRAVAKKAGLGAFDECKNDEYLALGDAPKKFQQRALEILVNLSNDYLKHFTAKGFAVKKPNGRMTVVMLANRESFVAYLGEDVPGLVGGTYNPDLNDLMIFDNRAAAANLEAQKDNTLVLTHEAVHQLTFNTGLLRRGGDAPKAIVEGIANYAELRSPNGVSPKIGDLNHRRLIALQRPMAGGQPLGRAGGSMERGGDPQRPIAGGPAGLASVEQLIRDDKRIDDPAVAQIAYSEAWLLVHYLMKTPQMLPKFRAYLTAIAPRNDAKNRMNDWTQHLGDPAATDRALVPYLAKLWAERGRR
jgi:Protein of unknown function (DUF1570)